MTLSVELEVTASTQNASQQVNTLSSSLKTLKQHASNVAASFMETLKYTFTLSQSFNILKNNSKAYTQSLSSAAKAVSILSQQNRNLAQSFRSLKTSLSSQSPSSSSPSFPSFSKGGLFKGKGSPTNDANIIALSDGEFIVNARATRAFYPLLKQINEHKIPQLKKGGLLSDERPTPIPQHTQQHITINVSLQKQHDPERLLDDLMEIAQNRKRAHLKTLVIDNGL